MTKEEAVIELGIIEQFIEQFNNTQYNECYDMSQKDLVIYAKSLEMTIDELLNSFSEYRDALKIVDGNKIIE